MNELSTSKYINVLIILPNNGSIEMINEEPRPAKGKGRQVETSSLKRIYRLIDVEVAAETLEKFTNIKKENGNIVEVSSISRKTLLGVEKTDNYRTALITGKATFQALELLGLDHHVKE